ncbi:hypothetical protein HMI54_006361 [Coelomomyces lativittatus]|nr:hypothetical protein HMI56_006979 [Coelomomyces lativittatus]KAJ1517264.1 hypothetical protein HMI54_006361 [Coelomomyces lativittatus]KAJ1517996.1 hypothetical protein HMI55_004154 [Coelomomyces lativittatus]
MQSGAFPAKSPIKEYFPGASGKFKAVASKEKSCPKLGKLKDEDYVKNLQQQIYLLELETRYLRSNKLQESKDAETNITAFKKDQEKILKELNGLLAETQAKLEASQLELHALQGEMEKKETDFEKLKEQWKSELMKKELALSSKTSECHRLEQLNARQKQIQESFQNNLTALQEEVYQVQTQLQLSQSNEKQYLRDQQDLQKSLFQFKNTTNEFEKMESQYQVSLNKIKKLEQEQIISSSELRQLKMTQHAKDQIQSKLESDMQAALLENSQLVQSLAKAEALMHESQKECSFFQEKLKQTEQQLEVLSNEKERVMASMTAKGLEQSEILEKTQKQLAIQNINLMQSKEELVSLKAAYHEEVHQVDELNAKIAQLQLELKSNQKLIQELEATSKQAKSEAKNYADMYNETSKEMKSLLKKNAAFNKVFDMVKAFETTGQDYLKEMHQVLDGI